MHYVLGRLLAVVPTLFISTIIVFGVIRIIPGDAIDVLISDMEHVGDPAEARQRLEAILGLDKLFYEQYFIWLWNALHGDLGTSLRFNSSVTDEIIARLPVTAELAVWSLVYALLIALPIGTYSAIRREAPIDHAARSFSVLAQAIPSFWLGVMVVLLPAVWWGWNAPRYVPFATSPFRNFTSLLLPALVVAFSISAVVMRMTRSAMLEVLGQDYIRTAWAKGASERRVVLRHAMKNAMIPVLSLLGIMVPGLFGGAVIVENIFRLQGLGSLLVTSVSRRDYPVILGIFLVVAVVVTIVNLLIDLSYRLFDPRIRNG